jgi:hypothetical protein
MHTGLVIPDPLLINTLGHAIGVVLFGVFLILAARQRRAGGWRRSSLSLLAATLALTWNLASLLILSLRDVRGPMPGIAFFGFSALSLLPAVLLHLALSGRMRPLLAAGYGLSATAIGFHFAEWLAAAEELHRRGLEMITYGFGLITLAATALLLRSREGRRETVSRVLGTMSLCLFAMSFVHLAGPHERLVWSAELAFHHAGIPLALLVLLQDYRFVLLDAFLRVAANVMLAALFVGFALAVFPLAAAGSGEALRQALLALGGCGLLIGYAVARGWIQRFLGRLVFQRPEMEPSIQELRELSKQADNEEDYLQRAIQRLAEWMDCRPVRVLSGQLPPREDLLRPVLLSGARPPAWAEAVPEAELALPLRVSSEEQRLVFLSGRSGGRRFLSEDLDMLSQLSAVIAEEAARLRRAELDRLVSQAELRALQAQINPHFLFNAFNTLYGAIPREASAARRMVLNLADLFRYFLRTDRSLIPLEEELRIVESYLEIERLRLGSRLRAEVSVEPGLGQHPVPVLSLQPLVENAIKHGIATRERGGWVKVTVRRCEGGVEIRVSDSGAGPAAARGGETSSTGVGLMNVSQRLKLCFGPSAGIKIERTEDGTAVHFRVPARRKPDSEAVCAS